jgi:activating signal cointegrator 1
MKALSITQPWASLVAIGAKQIETRSWSTRYRGRVAIHAAASFPVPARHLCIGPPGFGRSPFRVALLAGGYKGPVLDGRRISTGDLPLGAVIATATLVDVAPIGGPESFRTGVVEGDEGDYPGQAVLVRREAMLSWDPPGGTLMLDDPKMGVVDVSCELPFGDYSEARYGWIFADVERLPEPIPAKGALGLWEWEQ